MIWLVYAGMIIVLAIPMALGFYLERKRENIVKYPEGMSFWRKELRSSGHVIGGIISCVLGSRLFLYPLIDLSLNPKPIAPLIEIPLVFVGIGLLMLSGACLSWLMRK